MGGRKDENSKVSGTSQQFKIHAKKSNSIRMYLDILRATKNSIK